MKHICKGKPLLVCGCAAYLVQEQHYFMETVELKGLKYDPVLQDENSGFFIMLSSVLKSKVSPGSDFVSSNFSCRNYYILLHFFPLFQIKNVFIASSISHHYIDCSIVAYG